MSGTDGTRGTVFAVKPFEIHDGDGIRTTVFFKGCPLRCCWCHNPEGLERGRELLYDAELCRNCGRCAPLCGANAFDGGKHTFARELCTVCGRCADVCPSGALTIAGREMTAAEIAAEAMKDEMFMKGSGGGVTFSGGEPLLQSEVCAAAARILKEHGIRLAVDTCGCVPREAIERIAPYTDDFLFDLKAIDEEVHIRCTGVSNRTILENLAFIDTLGIPVEVRYPFVPGMNGGEAERIADRAAKIAHLKRVRVLGYHDFARRKYAALGMEYPLPGVPLPTPEELRSAREAFRRRGIETE